MFFVVWMFWISCNIPRKWCLEIRFLVCVHPPIKITMTNNRNWRRYEREISRTYNLYCIEYTFRQRDIRCFWFHFRDPDRNRYNFSHCSNLFNVYVRIVIQVCQFCNMWMIYGCIWYEKKTNLSSGCIDLENDQKNLCEIILFLPKPEMT